MAIPSKRFTLLENETKLLVKDFSSYTSNNVVNYAATELTNVVESFKALESTKNSLVALGRTLATKLDSIQYLVSPAGLVASMVATATNITPKTKFIMGIAEKYSNSMYSITMVKNVLQGGGVSLVNINSCYDDIGKRYYTEIVRGILNVIPSYLDRDIVAQMNKPYNEPNRLTLNTEMILGLDMLFRANMSAFPNIDFTDTAGPNWSVLFNDNTYMERCRIILMAIIRTTDNRRYGPMDRDRFNFSSMALSLFSGLGIDLLQGVEVK